jgi:hypothetical protein
MKKYISNLIILHFLSWSDKLEFYIYQAGNSKTKLREGEREGPIKIRIVLVRFRFKLVFRREEAPL